MFTIYQQIANRLRVKFPELRTIDYDKGQLADPEKAYPLDFPAVLISLEDIAWKDEGKQIQRGTSTIAITVALLPTEVFRQDSPTLNNFVANANIINEVFTVLKSYRGGETIVIQEAFSDPDTNDVTPEVTIIGASFSPLTRTRTQRMKRYDTIQAFTHLFTTSFTDNSAQPIYVKPEQEIGMNLKIYTNNTLANFPESL